MKKGRKEILEWVVLITVVGIIYAAGWHTEVLGKIQQAILWTGIYSPEALPESRSASYEFSLEDVNGRRVSFHEFEGKVVFLNFWATWCPPCVAEMPDIHELYRDMDSSVTFVMISLDKDEQKARDFIKKKSFDFPIYFLRSSLPNSYSVSSIPTTYVLDKEGMIRVENKGMAKYNTEEFKKVLTALSEAQ